MADDKNKGAAIRKRQQIDSSNRTMFTFVAGAAFIVGVAIVVSVFLVQQIMFNVRVINEKTKTAKVLKNNIVAVSDLKKELRVLESNEALSSVKIRQENSALQSVLDALPSEPNVDALGASLQEKFVGAVDGLSLDSLIISNDTGSGKLSKYDGGHLSFSLSVSDQSGGMDRFKELLTRFEKSIRVIEIQSTEIQSTDKRSTMSIKGRARYEPTRHIELKTKIIPLSDNSKAKSSSSSKVKNKSNNKTEEQMKK